MLRKNEYRGEAGYALVTVLLVLLVLSAVGMLLLSSVVNSQAPLMASEHGIDAQFLAEKGMNELTARVRAEVQRLNDSVTGSTTPGELLNRTSLLQADPRFRRELSTAPEDYGFRLFATDTDLSKFRTVLSLEASGRSAETRRTIHKTVTLSAMPELFTYSVIGEGDVRLYGGVEIEGNVFAKHILNASRQVPALPPFWDAFESTYPKVTGEVKAGRYFAEESTEYGKAGRTLDEYLLHQLNGALPGTAVPKHTAINIKKELNEHLPKNRDYRKESPFPKQDVTISGRQSFAGDLWIDGSLTISAGAHLIIGGNLYVKESFQAGDVLSSVPVTIEIGGDIHVEGDASLSYSTLAGTAGQPAPAAYIGGNAALLAVKGHSTIYSGGSTTLLGVTEGAVGTKSLAVLSDGGVILALSESAAATPVTLYAYLYSNSDVIIEGVRSNLVLRGGIRGRNIYLYAARGSGPTDSQSPARPSRLKIQYNPDIIAEPPDGLPAVNSLLIQEGTPLVQ